ncbi:MAG: hypothetical protein ACXVI0_10070 [Halobacteriota archaeon]
MNEQQCPSPENCLTVSELRTYIAEAKKTLELQRSVIDEQNAHIEHLRQEATDCRTKLNEQLKRSEGRLADMEKMMTDSHGGKR